MDEGAPVPAGLFHEVQRFGRGWLWGLTLFGTVLPAAVFAWGVVQQVVLGEPWGDHPLSDAGLIVITLLIGAFCAGVLWLLAAARLVTTVAPGVLRIRFTPFHRRDRVFEAPAVQRASPVTYRPLREYGGWGIRQGFSGRAYNVSGRRGVRLALRDGTRVLVGSARAEELASALAAAGFTVGPEER